MDNEPTKQRPLADNFAALSDFQAGLYVQKANAALVEAAQAAIHTGRKSQVTLEISFLQIEGINQVAVAHLIKKTIPHSTGDTTDRSLTKTPMHVHTNGQISPFSEDQLGFEFSKQQLLEK